MNRYILQVYDLDNNKVTGLLNYNNIVRERDLKTGGDTLSFSYPKKSEKTKYLVEEHYIETKDNRYVIKEVDKSAKNWVRVVCKVDKDGLKQRIFPHFEMVNSQLGDTLNLALAGTGWTIGHNDITKRRTVRLAWCTPLEIIEEIRKVYRAEIFYDARNKQINVYEQFGEDKGQFFMENVNLKDLSITSDTHDYITRLIPLGKDGLMIGEINNGKNYLENYQYSNKIIYGVWEDNRYSVVENLKEDGEVKLDELSKPLISYEGNSIDLRGANLGDTIELVSKTNNVKTKQRVVKITEYPLKPHEDKVEIANKVMSFQEQFNETEEVVEKADTVMTSDGMIDESKVNFNPIRQEFEHVIAQKADIVDLNAANARIGHLEVTKANMTDVEIINAQIENLYAEDLTAINADIINLQARVGEIDTILAMEVFAELIEVGEIRAGSGIIADGAIGDAQISYLTAGKIVSGTIDTSLVTVAGADGKLNITGNRLQVINDGKERVVLGDVNRDGSVYGLRVRGEDGETVLFDERGITREGITEGSIDDSKVDDSANIQGHKLDINSVIREVNDKGTETIKGTRVQVGDRTLDVELSTLESSITDNATEITHQRGLIQALDEKVSLKVDRQEFTQYKTTTDEEIGLINTQLSKNTSSIDILQEQIKLKVEQVDIENAIADMEIGGRNFLRNSNFSNGLEFWTNNQRTILDVEDDNILKVIFNQTYSTPGVKNTELVYLEPGIYTISSKIKSSNPENKIGYYVANRSGGSHAERGDYNNLKNEWQIYKKTFEVKDEGSYEVMILASGPKNLTDYILIDWIKLEKGNKATDWTPAPEDVDAEFTKINTQLAEINIDLNSITSRVQDTEYDLANVTNKVTILEQTAEDFSISIRKYEDGIFEGATYTFDGQNATFRGAGLVIQNDFGEKQLWQDTQGNLSMMGVFTSYQDTKKAIEMKGNSIYLYDWEGTPRLDHIGRIFTGRRNKNPDEPTLSLGHERDAHIAMVYKTTEGGYASYMDFDNYNRTGTTLGYSVSVNRDMLCKQDVLFLDKVRFAHNATPWIQKNPGNPGLDFIISGASNGGYSVKSASGYIHQSYLPGRDWPFVFDNHTRIQGNFIVTGSKNAAIKTKNHGEVLVNSYETAEYYNGDIGSGKLGEDGILYIYIDDIFDETINTFMNYHITYGKCGPGDIYTYKKYPHYFIVKGEPGLEFTWELKAKRDGYEYDRLEAPVNLEEEEELDISYLIENEEEKQADEELHEIIEQELTFDLADYVLGGDVA